jgi:hypothetical protein
MCAMTYLGEYGNPKIQKGLDYLMKTCLPGKGRGFSSWHFYGNYYGTVAMFQRGGQYWAKWWPAITRELVKQQSSNGSWTNGESSRYGPAFGTALALIALQVPHRMLPIFQRPQD